jgi:hypothetical protein
VSNQSNPNNYKGITVDNIVGTAVAAAEDKFDGQQTEVRIATNFGYYKDKQNKQDWTETGTKFFSIIARGDYANALRGIGAGDVVRVDDANLEFRQYTKDGQEREVAQLTFGTVTVVKKKDSSNQQSRDFVPAGANDAAPW